MIFGWLVLAGIAIFNPWSLEALTELYWKVEHPPARSLLVTINIALALAAIPFIFAPLTIALLRRATKNTPRMTAISLGTIMGLILIVLLLGGAELYCRLVAPHGDPLSDDGHELTGANDNETYTWDELLGYSPAPGINFGIRLVLEGRELYDVSYEVDQFGRRVTPINEGADPTKFALFFGCSFTYGEGVEGNETIPARFAAQNPDFRPYNYAYGGYGPQQMLARLQETDIREEIVEEIGFAVFIYIDDHVRRAVGDYVVATGHGSSFPFYVEKKGELVRGNISDSYPVRSVIFHAMTKSKLVQRLKIGYPFRLNDSHYRLTARIVEEARDSFQEKFGDLPLSCSFIRASISEIVLSLIWRKRESRY